jgi:hypothetical protein
MVTAMRAMVAANCVRRRRHIGFYGRSLGTWIDEAQESTHGDEGANRADRAREAQQQHVGGAHDQERAA